MTEIIEYPFEINGYSVCITVFFVDNSSNHSFVSTKNNNESKYESFLQK